MINLCTASYAVEMETVRIEHVAILLGTTTAEASHILPPEIIQTALEAVPHEAADRLPVRIATGARSCRMFNVQRANEWDTWLSIVTCWPPQSALNDT